MRENLSQDPPRMSRMSTVTKLAESKERISGMSKMLRKGISFNSVENFLQNTAEMRKEEKIQGKEESDVLVILMKKKLKDERRYLKS